MANNYFKEQYENSPQIRRGIDTILKSNNYTDEYKAKIRTYLEGIDIDKFSKEDSLSVSPSMLPSRITLSSRRGSTDGYIERPRYIEEEIKRALDVDVDELISLPPDQRPETVLKSKYDDLAELYRQSVADFTDLTDLYNAALSDIENLKLEIESLNQVVDAQKLLTAVANNEAQSANDRFSSLLGDFQSALQKGIQEAIERVSLEAQVRGLQAQKEVLKQLLDAATNLTELTREQLEDTQQRQAAAEVLDGIAGTYDQATNSGWKLPQSEITRTGDALFIRTRNDNDVRTLQGTAINIYNFSSEQEQTFTIQVLGESANYLEAPSSITIPAREGISAGRGYISLRWRPLGTTNSRNATFTGTVQINGSLGDSLTIEAKYEKEVKRRDTWSPRGILGTVVGSERN
jgi:hypothetical protein